MKFEDLKLLLVEDHNDTQQTLCMMLKHLGIIHINTANDGREALEYLDESDQLPHAILCDWNMPHVSGLEVLKQVRNITNDTPFIMITARGDATSVTDAKLSGVSGYILKPFSLEELKKKLELLVLNL